mmetsp:Transcript_81218/g.217072  ORF Transcript_81218/g.217072 Transcript_81218/m.217072 type:complete len:397 (+) Transcript_81218:180-1370(+)
MSSSSGATGGFLPCITATTTFAYGCSSSFNANAIALVRGTDKTAPRTPQTEPQNVRAKISTMGCNSSPLPSNTGSSTHPIVLCRAKGTTSAMTRSWRFLLGSRNTRGSGKTVATKGPRFGIKFKKKVSTASKTTRSTRRSHNAKPTATAISAEIRVLKSRYLRIALRYGSRAGIGVLSKDTSATRQKINSRLVITRSSAVDTTSETTTGTILPTRPWTSAAVMWMPMLPKNFRMLSILLVSLYLFQSVLASEATTAATNPARMPTTNTTHKRTDKTSQNPPKILRQLHWHGLTSNDGASAVDSPTESPPTRRRGNPASEDGWASRLRKQRLIKEHGATQKTLGKTRSAPRIGSSNKVTKTATTPGSNTPSSHDKKYIPMHNAMTTRLQHATIGIFR